MATQALSRDDIAFGRAILLATDSLGLSAEGALWLHDSRERGWQFFLVTSLFDRIGPREMYLRLNKALAMTLSEGETRDFALHIAGPNERLIADIRAKIKTGPHESEPRSLTVTVAGRDEEACVYRLTASLDESRGKRAQRRFRHRFRELVAA